MVESFTISYKSYSSVEDLEIIDQKLVYKSQEVLKNAYSVYSGFSVGAAALLSNGEIMAAKKILLILRPCVLKEFYFIFVKLTSQS